ncbi:MAG: hypothetical protein J6X62_05180, partial [Bacteroidales bacterium]|nr:hypothetical protein [Bacteroidales bacterium]
MASRGQGTPITKLNASNNGTTVQYSSAAGFILSDDDAGDSRGRYSRNKDYRITVCGSCPAPLRIGFTFDKFDVAPGDTLFIYDGNSINSPILAAANNNNTILFRTFYPSNLNTTGCLTLRFKTNADTAIGEGFVMRVDCSFPCEFITPVIEETYSKMRDGVVTETRTLGDYTEYDTAIAVSEAGDTTMNIASTVYHGATLCFGECLMLKAHGVYEHNYGAYNPEDATTTFRWDFGNGDTLVGVGAAAMSAVVCYHSVDCYDVTLSLTDSAGCTSTTTATIRVRLAQNPIKTIYDLANICNNDSLMVDASYGSTSTITLAPIEASNVVSKINPAKTFIPDGPRCPVLCYQAPVIFNEFPRGRTVQSKEDICSICINYEHSYMGDYELSIICPTQRKAILKYRLSSGLPAGVPSSAAGGGGTLTGYPYGGEDHGTYDGVGGNQCDTLGNMFGIGLDYCFSRNGQYTLVTGSLANDATAFSVSDNYLAASSYRDNITYTFGPIPAPYTNAGQSAGTKTFYTKHPSDHANMVDYYLPADDFSQLVGCPLNGQWDIEVCDHLGIDNGWVFNWSLDICGISSGAGCHYQVALDTIIWTPDSSYGDYDLGHYRGAVINSSGRNNINYVSTPDTAGTFPLSVRLIDEFGCIWDTATKITSTWTPEPDLGMDRLICDVEYAILDAKDRHTPYCNYHYMWEPTGSSNDTIHTLTSVGSSTMYTVAVYNEMNNLRCEARDSVRVNVNMQPIPNFDPGVFPLEGCEPFTINITNTSLYGNSFRWEFGDGSVSYEENPVHSYSAGTYGFKFFVTTDAGCQDSLVYEDLVTVYSSPAARFSWDPVNPTVLHPKVHFINQTEPQTDDNIYYWEIQYDKNNRLSYHTLTDVNPEFEWYSVNGE